ncbi:hypothetical protein HU200_067675 [Digitaria exilis]|uniref:Uncharacterized protein n=1 Tax=Digitaria exilis TaxID=1010633 RepID=A0A834ZVF6_9POAL|nr:hypothetical protein HU200_067675 [Digitaria exilis]
MVAGNAGSHHLSVPHSAGVLGTHWTTGTKFAGMPRAVATATTTIYFGSTGTRLCLKLRRHHSHACCEDAVKKHGFGEPASQTAASILLTPGV